MASLQHEFLDPGGLASDGDLCAGIGLEGHPLQFNADVQPMDEDDCGPEFEPPDTPGAYSDSVHSMVLGAARGEAAPLRSTSSSGVPVIRFVIHIKSFKFLFIHFDFFKMH